MTSRGYEAAEQIREQRGEEESDAFAELEQMMPELLQEMWEDIRNNPLIWEIIVLDTKGNNYNGDGVFVYYREAHADLDSKLQILGNHGLIHEITYNSVDRFRLTEEFVKYLRRGNAKKGDPAPGRPRGEGVTAQEKSPRHHPGGEGAGRPLGLPVVQRDVLERRGFCPCLPMMGGHESVEFRVIDEDLAPPTCSTKAIVRQ